MPQHRTLRQSPLPSKTTQRKRSRLFITQRRVLALALLGHALGVLGRGAAARLTTRTGPSLRAQRSPDATGRHGASAGDVARRDASRARARSRGAARRRARGPLPGGTTGSSGRDGAGRVEEPMLDRRQRRIANRVGERGSSPFDADAGMPVRDARRHVRDSSALEEAFGRDADSLASRARDDADAQQRVARRSRRSRHPRRRRSP